MEDASGTLDLIADEVSCPDDLMVIVNQYREADAKARKAVRKAFPIGRQIRITMTHGNIVGQVHGYVFGSADEVACLLENGNVWCYPVERLSLV